MNKSMKKNGKTMGYKHIKTIMIAMLLLLTFESVAHSARIKDIAHFEGIRANQLLGYGLVVGLDGTGDNQQAQFTIQSTAAMLSRMGIRIDPSKLLLRNVAAVMVTSTLPAFSKPGSQIDVVISSIGNARSLTGGTLILTPLQGVDSQTYAMAQGPVQVGGFGAGGSGGGVQKNHLNVGRIPQGAIVERSVDLRLSLGAGATLGLQLNHPDFSTARSVTDSINRASRIFGVSTEIAMIMDSGAIQMQVPEKLRGDVGRFIAIVESLEVFPDSIAKVVVNSRTGTVVMGEHVRISSVAVAHGGLTVRVDQETQISQPNPQAGGNTVVIPGSTVSAEEEGGAIQLIEEGVTLSDIVRGLNALGAKPRDLIDILQAIRAAGGLHGELEVL